MPREPGEEDVGPHLSREIADDRLHLVAIGGESMQIHESESRPPGRGGIVPDDFLLVSLAEVRYQGLLLGEPRIQIGGKVRLRPSLLEALRRAKGD
jgi:hypothetical protein